MKKLLVLLISLTILSCSTNDDSLETYQEAMPVESVTLPEEFIVNEDYEVTLTYLRPTTCHAFNDILLQKHNNQGNVYVIGTVFQSNGDCTELNSELEVSFNFKATQIGTYTFKFWQGENDNGEEIYSTVEVPVVE
ncbi:MAG: hypothetical protein QNK89_02720 [Lacinutrix sp.]|uniref:hypothetical protein n=1 Tax=Lacinutrix sp. TaxID=1937692 RepID=UPI0030A0EC06